MFVKTVLVLIFLLPLVSSTTDEELEILYDEFIEKVINYTGIRTKVKENLSRLDGGTITALKMFDASAKIPNGLSGGNAFDLGHFDSCLDIELDEIYGKYCLGTMSFSRLNEQFLEFLGRKATQKKNARILDLGADLSGLHFAACVPSDWAVVEIPGELTYSEDFCYSRAKERELTPGAIVTIVVLSIFGAMILVSTFLDIYFFYTKKEVPHEIFISFSFLTNGRKMFRSTTNPDQLLCLNGIKAISMMWIVIFHEYAMARNAPVSNLNDVLELQENPGNMFVAAGTIAVDTFFTVGGLVTVYTFLRSAEKGAKFNIILYYVHRYLRLTPVLAVVALIHIFLLNYFGYGPLWNLVDLSLVKQCERAWWSTILYITNYVDRGNCVPPTWYLSVDMQLFILSPLVLIPLAKRPRFGVNILVFLVIASLITSFVIAFVDKVGMTSVGEQTNFTRYYYKQTYARFGPYVIGMIMGYYTYKIKKTGLKIRLRPIMVLGLWLVCLTGLVACVYAGYPLYVAKEEDRWGNSMMITFQRPAWAVALSGLIFLCVSGYGGPIDTFLSLPIFQFLTKASYCMYLIHYPVIVVRFSSMKNNTKYSHPTIMHDFWGDFILTLVLAVIFSLSFESPILILEKYLFGRWKKSPKRVHKKPEA